MFYRWRVLFVEYLEGCPIKSGKTILCANPEEAIACLDKRPAPILRQPIFTGVNFMDVLYQRAFMELLCGSSGTQKQTGEHEREKHEKYFIL